MKTWFREFRSVMRFLQRKIFRPNLPLSDKGCVWLRSDETEACQTVRKVFNTRPWWRGQAVGQHIMTDVKA